MAKTILIPTDFSVESLNTLKLAIGRFENENVHVILMYAERLSDSITELLFYTPKNTVKAMRSAEFDEALSIVKNRYESIITSVVIEIFHGQNANAFRNFVEGKKVDHVFLPKNYKLQPQKNGFDPIPFIKKAKITFDELGWESAAYVSDEVQLNALFSF